MKIGKHRKEIEVPQYVAERVGKTDGGAPRPRRELSDHCPKMLPPYEAHGPHDNCAGLAAHPNVMIGRRS